MSKESQSPIKATWPDPRTIQCKDCLFRDKTEVKVGDKVIKVGVTKSYCAAYPSPPESNGKPTEILFQKAKCKYYTNEKLAVK